MKKFNTKKSLAETRRRGSYFLIDASFSWVLGELQYDEDQQGHQRREWLGRIRGVLGRAIAEVG